MGRRILILVTALLVLDQVLKIWVKTSMEPGEIIPLVDDVLRLNYVENRGMAFGTTLSDSMWGKLALSIFRLVAVAGIAWYLTSIIRKGESRKWFIYGIALVFVGALGNLIDGIFYDLFFEVDPNYQFNRVPIIEDGVQVGSELRPTGPFFGNVVDMFQLYFNGATYPDWVPWLGGEELFPAIFNLADISITFGVIILVFSKKEKPKVSQETSPDTAEQPEVPTAQESPQSTPSEDPDQTSSKGDVEPTDPA